MVEIIPCVFVRKNDYGDMPWMAKQNAYKDSLFVFADTIELLKSGKIGNGNTWLRQYTINNVAIPKAANIPVASIKRGKFTKLDAVAIDAIDQSITQIENLIGDFAIERIYYAADNDQNMYADNLEIDADINQYIVSQIKNLKNL